MVTFSKGRSCRTEIGILEFTKVGMVSVLEWKTQLPNLFKDDAEIVLLCVT